MRIQLFGWFRKRRHKQILARPWPDRWNKFLRKNVRLSRRLSEQQSNRLKDRTRIFIAEKNWEGLDGLVVTDEMKVTIGAQACMMLLGVEDFFFDNVKSILIFPEAFERQIHDGVSVGAQNLSGEAWQGGPVVLSWNDVLHGCRHPGTGSNVVIHEFAHVLDGLDGDMGGNIIFENRDANDTWEQVLQHFFDELVSDKQAGRHSLLDHYGATSKAEFFAVATEVFFEQPELLSAEYKELFELMLQYFKVNPINWQ